MCDWHDPFAPAPRARHAGEKTATLGCCSARGSFKSYGEVGIMTCREFKHAGASLTLWELSRAQGQQLLSHTDVCHECGAWLQQQRMLASAMQTLRVQTAGREAGPGVERALLRMFRQVPFEATRPVAAHRFTPIALRLSRFFEVGAYVAVAAAIVVGLFLGVRLLEERSLRAPVQSQYSPAPAPQAPAVVNVAPKLEPPVLSAKRRVASRSAVQNRFVKASGATAGISESDDPEYVALMFCDPLSCSTDAQVVRMEVPATGATADHDTQTQLADVVVGYDGVVRAMRIVNPNLN